MSGRVGGASYIKVGLFKFLQGSKVVVVSLQAGFHFLAPHHLSNGQHHLVEQQTPIKVQ